MSNSPLAGAMAQTQEPAKKKKKRGGALLMVSGLALVASLSGVFAANTISINGGADIEFGSGTEATTVCDSGMNASITQTFSGGSFKAQNIVISGIGSSCTGKVLSVILADSSNNAVCGVNGTGAETISTWTSNAATASANKFLINLGTISADSTLTVPVPANCESTSVAKIALATS